MADEPEVNIDLMKALISAAVEAKVDAKMIEVHSVIAEAAEAGVGRAFAKLGVDIATPRGISDWHENWALLRSMQKARNRAGNVLLGILVAGFAGLALSRVFPWWK